MSDQPCTLNASAWPLNKFCSTCGHGGHWHPGGSAGQFGQCIVCNLSYLEAALIERERMLGLKIAEAEALMLRLGATAARIGFNATHRDIP